MRISGVGGLYAPYVKWLPKFSKGLYTGEENTCVLISGLGAYGTVFRIFNLPELSVLTIEA